MLSTAKTPEPKRPSRRDPPQPLAIPVNEACAISGLGRTKIYELIGRGKLRTATVGRRRLVIFESIRSLLEAA